jgi:GT2 family glycosyltransferase
MDKTMAAGGTAYGEGGRCSGSARQYSPDRLLVSVITVVKNGAGHLAECMGSVLGQDWPDLEYIVIDGGSTDATLDIIRQHEDRLDYWLSEPDEGIFDAMNKGLALATGQLIGFLNADDRYEPGAVRAAAEAMQHHAAPAVYYGDHFFFQDDMGERYEMFASLQFWRGMTICHQAMFVHREVFRQLGGFALTYSLAADYDFVLRCFRAGVPFVHLHCFVASFRDAGASSKALLRGNREVSAILRTTYGVCSSPYLKNLLLTSYNLAAVACGRMIGLVAGQRVRARARAAYYRIIGRRRAS